ADRRTETETACDASRLALDVDVAIDPRSRTGLEDSGDGAIPVEGELRSQGKHRPLSAPAGDDRGRLVVREDVHRGKICPEQRRYCLRHRREYLVWRGLLGDEHCDPSQRGLLL